MGEGPGTRRPPRRSCIKAELPGRGLEMLRTSVAINMETLRGGGAGSEWNIFHTISHKDSFMILGIFAVSVFAVDIFATSVLPYNLLAVRQFCYER